MGKSVSDDVFQKFLYSIPMAPASGEASVLIRSKSQEPEAALYLANPPASVENEGSSILFQEVWMYASSS